MKSGTSLMEFHEGSAAFSRDLGKATPRSRRGSALALVDLFGRRGKDRVEVTDHAEVDELEQRGLLVLVDRDDRLGGLHARTVLDRAGDAGRDVQLRRHRLAGLTDLERVRVPARVDDGTRGAHGTAESVREALDRLEVAARAATTGHHDGGLGQLGTTRRLARLGRHDPGGLGGVGDGDVDLLLRTRALGLLGRRGVGLDRDDRGALGDLRLDRVVAREHALRRDGALLDVDGVGDQTGVDLDRETTRDLLALGVGGDEYGARAGALHQLLEHLGLRRDEEALDLRVVDDVDLLGTVGLQRRGGVVGRGADEHRGRLAETAGDRQELVGGLAHHTVDMVDENQDFAHCQLPDLPQMNFFDARNPASAVAPEPSSSVTISPCVRGGRAAVSSTWLHEADRPTWDASTPRSESDHVSTGFFFAAMIPLNEG